MAILVIANLWVEVFLNCVSTLDQDIASILVKSITDLFFYFVVGTRTSQQRDIEFAKSYLIEYKETRR